MTVKSTVWSIRENSRRKSRQGDRSSTLAPGSTGARFIIQVRGTGTQRRLSGVFHFHPGRGGRMPGVWFGGESRRGNGVMPRMRHRSGNRGRSLPKLRHRIRVKAVAENLLSPTSAGRRSVCRSCELGFIFILSQRPSFECNPRALGTVIETSSVI